MLGSSGAAVVASTGPVLGMGILGGRADTLVDCEVRE